MSATYIVAYLAFFATVGGLFVFVNLLLGRLLRPNSPNVEKLEVYECGEPTIGSSFIQFDLRFYVVALLFIIFDVEVAFFFPWAVVFGKATHLTDSRLPNLVATADDSTRAVMEQQINRVYADLGVAADQTGVPAGELADRLRTIMADFNGLALASIFDILVFFAVLMVGFAYVWRRGDLDWVRALDTSRTISSERPPVDLTDSDLEPTIAV